MRLKMFLNEDVVSDALALDEPSTGEDLPDSIIKRSIDLLNKAIDVLDGKIEGSSDDKLKPLTAKLADLEDKLEKYEKVGEPPESTIKGDGEPPVDEPPVDEPPPEEEE